MIDRETFRDALAGWASGVTIVACRQDGRVIATTVSAFMSLSLEPALIAVALGPNATVRPFLQPGVEFGVSVLSAGQRRMATVFADPFPVGSSPFPGDGPPVIARALIGLTCVADRIVDAGDHALIIASVHDAVAGSGAPLIRFERAYHDLMS